MGEAEVHARPADFGYIFDQEVRAWHLESGFDRQLVPGSQPFRCDLRTVKQGVGDILVIAVYKKLWD